MSDFLVYVIGPSGAGKDTLLKAAKIKLQGYKNLVFPERYITRPQDGDNEEHISVTPELFKCLEMEDEFVMSWISHGLYYGIHRQVEDLLNRGQVVVINGSRQYLPQALKKFPDLYPVLITAARETLEKRLLARARENAESIIERLEGRDLDVVRVENLKVIDNSNYLGQAVNEFCDHLVKIIKERDRQVAPLSTRPFIFVEKYI